MRTSTLLIVGLLLAHPLNAQELGSHAAIAPYLDSDTVLVAWLDLSQLETEPLSEFLEEIDGPTVGESQLKQIQAVQDTLVQLEVKRVYWLSDLASIPEGPQQLVIPTPKPQAVQLLMNSLVGKQMDLQFEQSGDVVLGGGRRGLAALREKKGEPTQQLRQAIASTSGEHGLAFATPTYVAMSLLGILKSSLRADDIDGLAKTAEALSVIRWLALSGSLPPDSARFEIHTKDPAAAQMVVNVVQSWLTERLRKRADRIPWVVRDSSVLVESSSRRQTVEILRTAKLSPGSRRMNRSNSMKQIAIALHNYAADNQHFPPQSLVDEEGNRLLSWRVLILPYLEQKALYDQFHLDEPWNSPHNLKLAATIPAVYQFPDSEGANRTADGAMKTRIVAPLTQDSIFGRPGNPQWFNKVIDGTSNTIWFVEATPQRAVIWTQPEDLVMDAEHPLAGLLEDESEGFLTSFVDGSVRFLSRRISPQTLNALITIDGHEVVEDKELTP